MASDKKTPLDEHALIENREAVAKALEVLFASEYIDRKKLYTANFVRGIFFSVGSMLGATVIFALLLWILSFFDSVPLIGPLIENFNTTVENAR